MEPFAINVEKRMPKADYIKVCTLQTLMGRNSTASFIFFVFYFAYALFIPEKTDLGSAYLVLGYCFLVHPLLILLWVNKEYKKGTDWDRPIQYRFTDDGIEGTQGEEIITQSPWDKIVKRKTFVGYMFLYVNKSDAFIIPLKSLSAVQLESIKQKAPKTR